jgi:hypothetical protein
MSPLLSLMKPTLGMYGSQNSINSIFGGIIMRKVTFAVMILFLAWAPYVFACAFDTDCTPGSRCIKGPGNIYGVCMGGVFPGNKYDDKPVYSPTDLNKTTGNTCTFDIDCGLGSVCLKGSGIYGVCIKK